MMVVKRDGAIAQRVVSNWAAKERGPGCVLLICTLCALSGQSEDVPNCLE